MTPMSFFRLTARTMPVVVMSLGTPLPAQSTPAPACDATMVSGSATRISATHASVYTATLIDASAAEVWAVLTDFDSMASWSSGTLQGMSGDIRDGGSVVITFLFGVDADGNPIANEIPHTLIYEDGVRFGWSDPFPADIGGGHDNHIYEVVPCGDQTLFVQSDEVVDNPYASSFVNQLLPLYQMFNAELKAEVEG